MNFINTFIFECPISSHTPNFYLSSRPFCSNRFGLVRFVGHLGVFSARSKRPRKIALTSLPFVLKILPSSWSSNTCCGATRCHLGSSCPPDSIRLE